MAAITRRVKKETDFAVAEEGPKWSRDAKARESVVDKRPAAGVPVD